MYVPKCRKAGQMDTSECSQDWVRAGQRAWLQPGGCALMGCRCPISRGQGWDVPETGLKEKAGTGRILDIMARESYLLQ